MKLRKYTLEQLEQAVESSVSLREVLGKLNIIPAGGNYSTLNKAIKHFNLSVEHFTGQNPKGRKLPQRRKSIEEYLTKNSGVQSNKLRRYLIDAKVFEEKCSCCNSTTWLDSPIPLELDHIDGDNANNELSNLRLLCPNCHALTPTYRGKNIKKT